MLLVLACIPEMDPAIDEATVLNDHTSVRIDAASSARTLFTLDQGARISVIEKRDTWYRVRDQDLIEGWMAESTVLRDSTRVALDAMVIESADQQSQNTVRTREQVNLRLAPGRDTTIIRLLRRGTAVEALERATTPRSGSDATDVWLKVRLSEDEVGWVYHQLVEYDIPEAILPFTEGRLYTAVPQGKCANLSWKLKRLQTPWFDGIGRNNIKPVRERSRDEQSVTFGEETQEVACAG